MRSPWHAGLPELVEHELVAALEKEVAQHMHAERLTVVHADADKRGAQKENIVIALDARGQPVGSLFIYPFFAHDTEPEHPHNLYLHFQSERGTDLTEVVRDVLLDRGLHRAAEIKREAGQAKTRAYACFFKHQQEEIDYFLRRGFVHDEGMYILERHASADLPGVKLPRGVRIESWRMETEAEQRRFIETHRRVFPRHPYRIESLRELMSLPEWHNFTAFRGAEISGNIMLFAQGGTNPVGTVEDLFVQKRWRRRGIGKCLLHRALTHFQNIGIHCVQLQMWSANTPALHLYRMFGFSEIDEIEIAVGRYV